MSTHTFSTDARTSQQKASKVRKAQNHAAKNSRATANRKNKVTRLELEHWPHINPGTYRPMSHAVRRRSFTD